jgi:hypothetical protein
VSRTNVRSPSGSQSNPASRPGLAAAAETPAAPPSAAPPDAPTPPKPVSPKLIVLRGERMNAVYPIYEGRNVIGRFADKPVDIDLDAQEIVERIRVSRAHAVIHFEKGVLQIEDLNSLNGTWVNGIKVYPGMQRRLTANDVIQVGTVQLRLLIEPSA